MKGLGAVFTGRIAAGADVLEHVQGRRVSEQEVSDHLADPALGDVLLDDTHVRKLPPSVDTRR